MQPDLPQIVAAEYLRETRLYEAQKQRLLKEATRRVEQRSLGRRLVSVVIAGTKRLTGALNTKPKPQTQPQKSLSPLKD